MDEDYSEDYSEESTDFLGWCIPAVDDEDYIGEDDYE